MDLLGWKPHFVWERKPLTREDIQCKVIKDMAFRRAARRAISLLVGPWAHQALVGGSEDYGRQINGGTQISEGYLVM